MSNKKTGGDEISDREIQAVSKRDKRLKVSQCATMYLVGTEKKTLCILKDKRIKIPQSAEFSPHSG